MPKKTKEQIYKEFYGEQSSLCPVLPPIPASIINWKGVEWRKDEDDLRNRYHWYAGPIEVGMVFAWEPDLPHARELIIVVGLSGPIPPLYEINAPGVRGFFGLGDDDLIWTTALDSPWRSKTFYPTSIPGHRYPNDYDRFREAVVPTMMRPQKP